MTPPENKRAAVASGGSENGTTQSYQIGPVIVDDIPLEMKSEPRWSVWRYESSRGRGKPTKVAYSIRGANKASSTEPADWAAFDAALARYQRGGWAGIGFRLGDGWAGVDLDDALNDCGSFTWGAEIVASFNTYTEVSPSGTGVKLFMCGVKPTVAKSAKRGFGPDGIGKLEAYDHGRWFAVTGQLLEGKPAQVNDCTTALADLCGQYLMGSDSAVPADDAKPAAKPDDPSDGGSESAAFRQCLADMLKMRMTDGGDGSRRLYAAACRAVEHGLANAQAVRCIREYARLQRFPTAWTDAQIDARLKDAERATKRGKAEAKRKPLRRVERYRPFPVDVLSGVLRRFVEDGARALGCDPAYIALPLLAALSSAIGNSRTIQIKPGWTEPAVLWAALVAASGTLKSPAIKLAMRSLVRRQTEAWNAHTKAVEEHKKAKKEWKAQPASERGEEPPEPPALDHFFCGDVTVEALAMRIGSRGLLVTVDELAGWFKSWNQYKSNGGDCESYLSFYDAAAAKIDRKVSIPPTIYIPRAFVAVAGGIQPGILHRLLTDDHFDSGLLARFLIAHPPESVVTWRDDSVSAEILASVDDVFTKLWALSMRAGDDGSVEPVPLTLTEAARRVFAEYVNRNGAEYAALSDDRLKAAWAKLRGAAARLALVLHCSAVAAGEQVYPNAVDETSITGGVKLADWFGHEATRLYAVIGESSEDRHSRELVDLIREMGGRVTVRELRQKRRRYRDDPEQAQADLDRLAEAGAGAWAYPPSGDRGGRPPTVFVLSVNSVNVNETPETSGESDSSVDVDGVDVDENGG